MKKQDPRLFSLAQEWARLRQDALIDREPAKIAAILERLEELRNEAKQVMSFKQ